MKEPLTKCKVGQWAPADDAAGQAEEGFVNVVADFPADAQAAEPVRQREAGVVLIGIDGSVVDGIKGHVQPH
jgi:hypothetical protein